MPKQFTKLRSCLYNRTCSKSCLQSTLGSIRASFNPFEMHAGYQTTLASPRLDAWHFEEKSEQLIFTLMTVIQLNLDYRNVLETSK